MFATYVLGLLLVSSSVFTAEARNVTYCLSNDTEPYLAFATKTSYEYISSLRSPINSAGVVGCKPVQVWILFRHGTRYPGIPDLENLKSLESLRDQVVANHEIRFNGNLCDKDLDNLKAWRYDLDASKIDKLAPQGYSDLLFIGKRMKTQFANVLNTTYSAEKFVFQHTDTERSMKSASSFAEGLFGKDANVVIPDGTPEGDRVLLRPYSNCSAWDAISDLSRKEISLFEETETMKTLLVDVSKRLGFQYNLTMDLVQSLYDMCRFDKAWNYTMTSPWCAAFTIEELQILEYAEDLKYYYKSSYGSEMNLKLACPLLKDMYEKFSKTAENSSDSSNPVGTFYFSHASMVDMFTARLGMAPDATPLTHSNYYAMGKRNFRTSHLVPFASNTAVVFYKCTSGEENQVMFYRNEKLISYDGCNVGLCSWKMIKEKFASIVDPSTCNIEFCKGGSGGSTVLSPVQSLVLGVVAVLVFRLS